jgi:hypothetical protein
MAAAPADAAESQNAAEAVRQNMTHIPFELRS